MFDLDMCNKVIDESKKFLGVGIDNIKDGMIVLSTTKMSTD